MATPQATKTTPASPGTTDKATLRQQWAIIHPIITFRAPASHETLSNAPAPIVSTAIKYEQDYLEVLRAQSNLDRAERELVRLREIVSHRQMNYHAAWDYIGARIEEFVPKIHDIIARGEEKEVLLARLTGLMDRVRDIETSMRGDLGAAGSDGGDIAKG